MKLIEIDLDLNSSLSWFNAAPEGNSFHKPFKHAQNS